MGHFFHAVGVFFHHLAEVDWKFLAYAVACHIVKLLFRAVAWRSIINAAYPDGNHEPAWQTSPPRFLTKSAATPDSIR